MSLSLAETRAQTRSLRLISFWLQPKSRSFDFSNSKVITIEDIEKMCGSIRDTRFDPDMAAEIVLDSAFIMAEGYIVEYAASLGYTVTDFKLPTDYSLISRLPNGDAGTELALTLAVLQCIIDGNEAISARAEVSEKLEKLKETKAKLDDGTFDIRTVEDRILNFDEVSEMEIEEFIDQIVEDKDYQAHLSAFKGHEYYLHGAKHVQFLQNAYKFTHTINMSFYETLFSTMESIADRLSDEELETALTSSVKYFEDVKAKKNEYVHEFKLVDNSDENRANFTARVLILGPAVVCAELCKVIDSSYSSGKSKEKKKCVKLLADIAAPLYKVLLEGNPPYLLMNLFGMKPTALFHDKNFLVPMECIVLSGTYPLHKLLNMMLKDSQNFKRHLVKLFKCDLLRNCIRKASRTDEWEETVQGLITAISIIGYFALPDSGLMRRDIFSLLRLLKTISEDGVEAANERGKLITDPEDLEWMSKYENHEELAMALGLSKKEEELAKESSIEEGEEGEAIEKTQEDGDTEEEEEEGVEEQKKEKEEEVDEEEEEGVDEDKKEEDEGVNEETKEEEEGEETAEGEDDEEQEEGEVDTVDSEDEKEEADEEGQKEEGEVEEKEDSVDDVDVDKEESDKMPDVPDRDNVAKEESAEESDDAADSAEDEEEEANSEQVPQNIAGAAEDDDTEEVVDDLFVDLIDEMNPGGEEQNDTTEGEDEEGLAATQSSTNSQDADGFTGSLNNLDKIGKK